MSGTLRPGDETLLLVVRRYDPDHHELVCLTPEGKLIRVDPFVGLAIDTGGQADYRAIGASLVGSSYIARGFWHQDAGGSLVFLPRSFKRVATRQSREGQSPT
jgi:hypothetical protein